MPVKRKAKKSVRKKVSRRANRHAARASVKTKKVNKYGLVFLRLVFILLMIFGGYRAWSVDWAQGIYIISGAVVIWLIIELIKSIKK